MKYLTTDLESPQTPPCGGVYFIAADETNRIKIGVTGSFKARMHAIQCCAGTPLRFVGFIENADMEMEAALHQKFRYLNAGFGEWFNVDEKLVDEIKSINGGKYTRPAYAKPDLNDTMGVLNSFLCSKPDGIQNNADFLVLVKMVLNAAKEFVILTDDGVIEIRKENDGDADCHVSPARAAKILGLHRNTVYGWAMDAVAGESSKFRLVKRNPTTGYLKIPVSEVERIKNTDGE